MFDCYDTLITPEEVADMLGCGMNINTMMDSEVVH